MLRSFRTTFFVLLALSVFFSKGTPICQKPQKRLIECFGFGQGKIHQLMKGPIP